MKIATLLFLGLFLASPPNVLEWRITHHLHDPASQTSYQRRVHPAPERPLDVAYIVWSDSGASKGVILRQQGECFVGMPGADPFYSPSPCHQIINLEAIVRSMQ